jgi:hypothetical protein
MKTKDKKIESIRLTHHIANRSVGITVYFWDNTDQSLVLDQEDFLKRIQFPGFETKA